MRGLMMRFWFVVLVLVCASSALGDVVDVNLQACIDKHARKHEWQAPSDFTQLVCHNKGIRTLRGLEAYGQLRKLSLHKNKLTRFDLSPFPVLSHLNLARNNLTALTLQNHQNLSALYIFGNHIEELTLSKLPELRHVKGNSNAMRSFVYEAVPGLKKVYLFDNEMEDIDINNLPSLTYMDVRENPMPDPLYEAMDAMRGVTILHDGNAEDWNP